MDPLYDKIEDRLSADGRRKVNPTDFETCAVSLLMPIYPGLAPFPGGGDGGFDGAVGTIDGAYPLIVTTQANVLHNVRKSIRAFLARRYHGPKRAVVATSRALTPDQKRTIDEAAGDLGVRIVNIHDRPYFVERLYRDSVWRRTLLGISGHPPALSRYPLHGRYAPPDVIIGRETDLAWLRETPGDLLLVGQPGSGKTYLHQVLATEGRYLFAVDFDRGRLADALRAQEPAVVVVDDAHFRREELETLVHTRYVTEADFAIHANCWPTHADDLRRRLKLGPAASRQLGRLPSQLIVELIKRLGIKGPNELLHLLLNRSDRMPGLAAALVDACKRDDMARVWSGEAVVEHLLAGDAVALGSRGRTILGALSLGGDAGLLVEMAADVLDIPAIDAWSETVRLGLGGVVNETAEGRLQVRPPAIRPLLLLETLLYASFPHRLNQDLIDRVPSIADTAHELIGARQREADRVDPRLLLALALRADRADVWQHLALADVECAAMILDEHPEKVLDAAPGLLRWSGGRALPFLLDRDVSDDHRYHVREAITEWLSPATHGESSAAQRRPILLDAVRLLWDRGGEAAAGTTAWALGQVLGLSFHHAQAAAGEPTTGVLTDGLISLSDVELVANLWPPVLEVIASLPLEHVRQVLNAIELWCNPTRLTFNLKSPERYKKLMQATGRRMLGDIANRTDAPRAIRSWAARVNAVAKFGIRVQVDELFDALFSRYRQGGDSEATEKRHHDKLQALASRLVRRPVAVVAAEVAELDREALAFGETTGDWDRRKFFYFLALQCEEPERWIAAAVGEAWKAQRLVPFLDRIAGADTVALERVLADLLRRPTYAQMAAYLLCLNPANVRRMYGSAITLQQLHTSG